MRAIAGRAAAAAALAVPVLLLGADAAQRAAGSQPGDRGDSAMTFRIESTAFKSGEPIPRRYTGDGEDVSVPLRWSGAPPGTREFALIVDDPDAPRSEPWVHWVIYGLAEGTSSLPEGVPREEKLQSPSGALQGVNSWGSVGYRGPAPPRGHGVHHYHFRLYALDAPLNLPPGLDKQRLLAAIKGHVLGECQLVGTYQR